MSATISQTSASTSTWTITITDTSSTHGWTFTKSVDYTGTGSSAEWILEAPSLCSATRCTVATLADYASTVFDQGTGERREPEARRERERRNRQLAWSGDLDSVEPRQRHRRVHRRVRTDGAESSELITTCCESGACATRMKNRRARWVGRKSPRQPVLTGIFRRATGASVPTSSPERW